MVRGLAEILANNPPSDVAAKNAILEAFVIHTRVLIGFFFDDTPRTDDAVAGDFFFDSGIEWTAIRGSIPTQLDKIKARAGKEVAHLTYARLSVTPESKGWDIQSITSEIDSTVRLFVRRCPQDNLGEGWNLVPK